MDRVASFATTSSASIGRSMPSCTGRHSRRAIERQILCPRKERGRGRRAPHRGVDAVLHDLHMTCEPREALLQRREVETVVPWARPGLRLGLALEADAVEQIAELKLAPRPVDDVDEQAWHLPDLGARIARAAHSLP